MGMQNPVSDIGATCDQAGCADTLRMIPVVPAFSNEEVAALFASLGWLFTSAKKVYCPKHKTGKK